MLKEIKKEDLNLNFDSYDFSSVKKGEKIIGQDKALGLLKLGLSISKPGYNIFLSGEDGSGRLTAVKQEVEEIEKDISSLKDACYLFNSSHPLRPICVLLKRGGAKEFQRDLDLLRDNKVTRESLIEKWKENSRLVKFLINLPDFEKYPNAWKILSWTGVMQHEDH